MRGQFCLLPRLSLLGWDIGQSALALKLELPDSNLTFDICVTWGKSLQFPCVGGDFKRLWGRWSEIQHGKLREQRTIGQALMQLGLPALRWGWGVSPWKVKFPERRVLLERPASEMSALEAGFLGHFQLNSIVRP